MLDAIMACAEPIQSAINCDLQSRVSTMRKLVFLHAIKLNMYHAWRSIGPPFRP